MKSREAYWKVVLRYHERQIVRGIVYLGLAVLSLAPVAVDLYCVQAGVRPERESVAGVPGIFTLEERRSLRTGDASFPVMDSCTVGVGQHHLSLRTFKDAEGDPLLVEFMSHRNGPHPRRALTLWNK